MGRRSASTGDAARPLRALRRPPLGKRRGRARSRVRVAGRVAALTVLYASLTSCNWFGATGDTGCVGNMADDTEHTFYFLNVVHMRNPQIWSNVTTLDQPTRVSTRVVATESEWTDVIIREIDLTTFCGLNTDVPGANVIGGTICGELYPGRPTCDKHVIYYDLSDTRNMNDTQRVRLACHETGHSLGLMHRGDDKGCMIAQATYDGLTDHDIEHLNALPAA
jgi:hypothetical protein